MFKNLLKAASVAAAAVVCSVMLSFPASAANVRVPAADGTVTYENGRITVDASHTSDGYVMVKYTGKAPRIKVRITKDTQYTYDLNTSGQYETFPLTEGDGNYTIQVFENISGTMYSTALSKVISVTLADQNSPFLYPNQFCDFNAQSKILETADSLTANLTKPIDKVAAIYKYTVNNISYDYDKAKTVQSGYLPNVDNTLETKKGICFDYASFMCAMLRSQNVPTKLVIGYTGNIYHAWISVYAGEQGWIDNVIYFDGISWKFMDPTFASSGKDNPTVKEYINNAANYQAKFSY